MLRRQEVVPFKIVCCYAHEDLKMLKHLEKHLMSLQRLGRIRIWSDTNLNVGMEWEKELCQHLVSADVILLLISPDFVSSDFCYNTEMPLAIERHNQGMARVIAILLRPTFWDDAPFAKQIVPTDAMPVTSWSDHDEAFRDITEHVNRVVSELRCRRALAAYEQILAVTPDAYCYEQAGKIYLRLACYQEALEMYTRAIEMTEERNPYLYAGKGQALLQLGEYEEALFCYQTTIKLSESETDPQFYHDLGMIHERLAQRARIMEQQTRVVWRPKAEPDIFFVPAYDPEN